MDRFAQAYLAALAAFATSRATGTSSAKTAGVGDFLSGIGQGVVRHVQDGSAWNAAKAAPGVVGSFLKNQGRELTYGPFADLGNHAALAARSLGQGHFRDALGQGVNAGLDGVSGAMNLGLLVGEPLSGGADTALIPAKEGLMYGLRRLAAGAGHAATMGLTGAPRAAVTDAVRAVGPSTGLLARAGQALHGGLEAGANWLHGTTNPLVRFATGTSLPAGAAGRGAFNAATHGFHLANGLGAFNQNVSAPLQRRAVQNYLRTQSVDGLRRDLGIHPQVAQAYAQSLDQAIENGQASSADAWQNPTA